LEDIAVSRAEKDLRRTRLQAGKRYVGHVGRAEKVSIDKDNTTIVNGAGKKPEIQARIANQSTIESTTSDYDKEKLQERLAKLSGGEPPLCSAATEVEMKEKKDRVDDALHATRAAVQEGIVPGGGVAYIRAIEALKDIAVLGLSNEDQATGVTSFAWPWNLL